MEELAHTYKLAHQKVVNNRRIIICFVLFNILPFALLELFRILKHFVSNELISILDINMSIIHISLIISEILMTYLFVRASYKFVDGSVKD
jgi:hypothetical protein